MSEWKVSRNPISCDEYMYGVYRIIDETKPDHSGNREIKGYHKSRAVAESVARELNGGGEDE